MVTNLFSVFDPATKLLSFNWLSIMLFLFVTPYSYYPVKRRFNTVIKDLVTYLLAELKPLRGKSPYALLLIISMFIYLAVNNAFGLTSYTFTASSHLSITISFALPAWLGFILFSFIKNFSNTLIHIIPIGTPKVLIPFMVMIETIRNIIRPITLSVRLAANIIAGHLLLVLIRSATAKASILSLPLVIRRQLALSVLEIAVSLIQAYVIRVLVTLYMNETN